MEDPQADSVSDTMGAVMETEAVDSLTEVVSASAPKENVSVVAVDGGLDHTVILYSDGTVKAVGSNGYEQCQVDAWSTVTKISTLYNHTVALKSDGTVYATGDNSDGQCEVDTWTDIIDISAGKHHTVGLKSDGTVVTAGKNQAGECDLGKWKDIVAVGAAYTNTFGLCSDGTVIGAGSVVTKDIPSGVVAVGVPCRVLREITEEDKYKYPTYQG